MVPFTPKRALLLRRARSAHRELTERLEAAYEALSEEETPDSFLEEMGMFEQFINSAYELAFGDLKGERWQLFSRALERACKDETAQPAALAQLVIQEYAAEFPEAADKLDSKSVGAAVDAWRRNRGYFESIHAALKPAWAPEKTPSARSMSTIWSVVNERKHKYEPPPAARRPKVRRELPK